MATTESELFHHRPIQRISVYSTSGVKQLYNMLPLCTERHVIYPDPMSYSDPDKYCYKFLQQSGTSDSAYYSHSSGSNAIVGGSLHRPRKLKRKEGVQLDSLMLASHPRYVINQYYGTISNRRQISSDNERREAVIPPPPGPDMSSGLYTAIVPRKHDPSQPSTSAEPPRTTPASITIPPSLLRIINAPPKTSFTKLRLCLKLNEADYSNPKVEFENSLQNPEGLEEPQFLFTVGNNRIASNQAYHTVFPTKTNPVELCGNCLPELIQTVFGGQDASLMYFGAISRHKQDLLYSRVRQNPASNGIFVSAIQWLFRIVDECRIKKKDVRYSFRVSALHYSQKKEELIDLLSDVSSDSPSDQVKCSEDPALGITVENRSEIRVETVDQALFYLDRVYDHRVTEEEEVQRSSHTFFYLTLYRYKSDGQGLQSGKSRLCLIDLGLGEKNSKTGYMTMPVLGNILLAIFQGQKHLPSRQNSLCRLLKESIGSARNKATVVLSTFNPVEGKCPVETENLVQLAAKMHKAVRKNTSSPGSRRNYNYKSDSSISNEMLQNQGPTVESAEYNSSSEQSCAETVIFLGNGVSNGLGYNGSSALPPVPGSPIKRKSSSSKGSHSGRRSNNSFGTPEPISQIIPIDCPPNAVVHSSASLHSLSLNSSPKRPTYLFQRNSGSMPGTPTQSRSARQSSVPTDLILCNPMAMNSNEKLNGSLKRSKKQNMNQLDEDFFNIDPEKREMVLNWVMEQKIEYGADICGIGKPFPQENNQVEKYITGIQNKVDSCIQCNEEDIDAEFLNIWNQARFLDDIVEDDEEPSTASMKSPVREFLVERSLNILSKESDVLGDLSKLAIERINYIQEEEEKNDIEMTDEELEKAMAASISSIKSHEILSKIISDFPQEIDSFSPSLLTSESKAPTETDMFRRASHLEAYAAEKLKELQELEKKDFFHLGSEKIKQMLHCADPVTTSVYSECTKKSEFSEINPKIPENKKEESLLSKLKLKQLTCCNTMTTSVASSTSIGTNTIYSNLGKNPFKTIKVSATKPIRTLSPMKEYPTKEESPTKENKKEYPMRGGGGLKEEYPMRGGGLKEEYPMMGRGLKEEYPMKGGLKEEYLVRKALKEEYPMKGGLKEEYLVRKGLNEEYPTMGGGLKEEYSMKEVLKEEHLMKDHLVEEILKEEHPVRGVLKEEHPLKDRKISLVKDSSIKKNPLKDPLIKDKKKEESPSKESLKDKKKEIFMKEESPISLPPEVAKQITDQLRSAGLGKSPSLLPISTSPVKSIPRSRKDSDSKKSSKIKNSKERRGSSESAIPSPYSKITTAKIKNNTCSSGHGSDETYSNNNGQSSGTGISVPQAMNIFQNKNRPRNRESFSASSGYESADYGKYKIAIQSPSPNGTTKISGIKKPSASVAIIAQKEISNLRALRDSLVLQLSEAQKRLGLPEQVIVEDESKYANLSSDVLIDLLKQETRQLEKRLAICKSHTMMVTTFL